MSIWDFLPRTNHRENVTDPTPVKLKVSVQTSSHDPQWTVKSHGRHSCGYVFTRYIGETKSRVPLTEGSCSHSSPRPSLTGNGSELLVYHSESVIGVRVSPTWTTIPTGSVSYPSLIILWETPEVPFILDGDTGNYSRNW